MRQNLGVGVLIADTGYELYAACETVKDLDLLYLDLGIADEVPDDVMHSACDPTLPEPGQVWGGGVDQVDDRWDELVEVVWQTYGQSSLRLLEIEEIPEADRFFAYHDTSFSEKIFDIAVT